MQVFSKETYQWVFSEDAYQASSQSNEWKLVTNQREAVGSLINIERRRELILEKFKSSIKVEMKNVAWTEHFNFIIYVIRQLKM